DLRRRRAGREARRDLGQPAPAGLAFGHLRRARCARRLLHHPEPHDARLRGARSRLQSRGGTLRRDQRRAQLHHRHGHLRPLRRARRGPRHPRLAVPARRARRSGLEHRLHRHRGRAPRSQYGGRSRFRRAPLRRPAHRNLHAQPRPEHLSAPARRESRLDDPCPRAALRGRGLAHPLHLAGTQEGPHARTESRSRRGRMSAMQYAARVREKWAGNVIIARVGLALGLFAFVVALPPFNAPVWVPVFVGFLAFAAGIWVLSRGMRRPGWTAIGFGIVGIGLGVLATRASTSNIDQVVVWSALLSAKLIWATPLTYAAIGGLFCERSGVVNIGLEGMMLGGAFFAALGADKFGNWEMGLVCAAAAGAGLAAVHAVMCINLRADQVVSGFAINFLALGLTGYFFIDIYGENGTPGDLPRIPDVNINFLGSVFGHLNLMIWVSFALLIVAHITLFHTPVGLRIRSVGEHPRAADTVGISVYGTRYAAVILSGILAALGGAYLSIGYLGSFSENMTAGRGYIALAAVIFGNWRPFGAFAAALLFGGTTALSFRLQQPWPAPSVLFQALPYVLTLIAVAGVIGRSVPPAAA